MKNKEKNDRLLDFDWEEHLERRMTFDDSHLIENGIPFSPPVWEVGSRARVMADMLLRELKLDFTTDDVDAFFDPADVELDYGAAQDDESLFEAVKEIMKVVMEYASSQFICEDIGRTPFTAAEKDAFIDRLGDLHLVDGCIIPDEECDGYMEGLEE
jgi:hypothetical protein